MFDIGFQELAILFVIGLVVLGPERLPRVARTLGAYVSKARRTWNTVRRDIENELAADDLKKAARDSMDTVRGIGEELQRPVEEKPKPADEPEPSAEMPKPLSGHEADA